MATKTEISNYLSCLTDTAITELTTLKTNYTDSIDSAIQGIDKLDFTGWEDTISSALKTHCTDLKNTYYNSIQTDITSGNFSVLTKLVNGLKSKCEEYKKWDEKSYSKPNLSDEDKAKWNSGSFAQRITMSGNTRSQMEAYERNVASRSKNLESIASEIDRIVSDLQSLEFSGSTVEDGAYNLDFSPIDDDTTSTDGGSTVVSEEVVSEYIDPDTGMKVTTTMTTEIVEYDGQTYEVVTRNVTITDPEDGALQWTESTQVARNTNDPECGMVIAPTGETYVYDRGTNGELQVTTYTQGKHNKTNVDGPESVQSIPTTYTYTDSQTGETTTSTINADNLIDTTLIRMDYENARAQAGVKYDHTAEGIHFLWNGDGDSISVGSGFGNVVASMSLSVNK